MRPAPFETPCPLWYCIKCLWGGNPRGHLCMAKESGSLLVVVLQIDHRFIGKLASWSIISFVKYGGFEWFFWWDFGPSSWNANISFFFLLSERQGLVIQSSIEWCVSADQAAGLCRRKRKGVCHPERRCPGKPTRDVYFPLSLTHSERIIKTENTDAKKKTTDTLIHSLTHSLTHSSKRKQIPKYNQSINHHKNESILLWIQPLPATRRPVWLQFADVW